MLRLIERTLCAEAKKRMGQHSKSGYLVKKYRSAFEKRTGLTASSSPSGTPELWDFHKQFDPRYCLGHARFLAKGLWSSLRDGTYEPVTAREINIPKDGGDFRRIDIFSIPDAAVAKIFLSNLRSRNAKIFSDASYAYQEDKQPLDAVLRLSNFLQFEIVFISQYDFSKFFDSISHRYISKVLADRRMFLTTTMERAVIDAVVKHRSIRKGERRVRRRRRGTPQGNSISLFVANIAAHSLDMELSRKSGAFSRFADDAVVVNYSYEDAIKCAEAFQDFSLATGVQINQKKSTGIRVFSERASDTNSISSFTFLSYTFTRNGLALSVKAKKRIKARCAKIIFNHLILHIKRTMAFDPNRRGPGFVDWDLVTCLNELRNFIYGGRRQRDLDAFLASKISLKNISGAVSYFCLIEQGDAFRELDGWLAFILQRAYAKRLKILTEITGRKYKSLAGEKLVDGTWYKYPKVVMETTLPSFFTAWRAARKSWNAHGLGGVDTAGFGYGYDT